MSKKKIKQKKTKQKNSLITASFLDKKGKKVNISKILTKDDCWFLKKANSWILTHKAIKKIANLAGISKNYEVEESKNIVPAYTNHQEHIVRVTIHCNAKKDKKGSCVHSDENFLIVTGEANNKNTPNNRGRGYLRKMAEKRAYDIAVLEHLELYSSVFSEEESIDFEQKKERATSLVPGSQEFERITTEINAILNTKTLADLKRVARKIKKGIKESKYTDKQINYLRELHKKEYGKKNKEF